MRDYKLPPYLVRAIAIGWFLGAACGSGGVEAAKQLLPYFGDGHQQVIAQACPPCP